jgi:hypothetical protein
MRESQQVEERVATISDLADWDRETAAAGEKLVVLEVRQAERTALPYACHHTVMLVCIGGSWCYCCLCCRLHAGLLDPAWLTAAHVPHTFSLLSSRRVRARKCHACMHAWTKQRSMQRLQCTAGSGMHLHCCLGSCARVPQQADTCTPAAHVGGADQSEMLSPLPRCSHLCNCMHANPYLDTAAAQCIMGPCKSHSAT